VLVLVGGIGVVVGGDDVGETAVEGTVSMISGKAVGSRAGAGVQAATQNSMSRKNGRFINPSLRDKVYHLHCLEPVPLYHNTTCLGEPKLCLPNPQSVLRSWPMSETLPPLEQFVLTLFDIGAVQLGKFRLHSGKRSRIYLDLRLLVSHPQALRQAVAAYRTVLDQLSFDLLAATPLAGLPLGTALCLDMNKPLIYPRKTAKSYGTGKQIEGVWQVGQTAVVIDDLITSGDSILEAIVALKASGLQVNEAVVLIDREQGGVATMQEHGYKLHAATNISRVLAILEAHQRITSRERDKVMKSLG